MYSSLLVGAIVFSFLIIYDFIREINGKSSILNGFVKSKEFSVMRRCNVDKQYYKTEIVSRHNTIEEAYNAIDNYKKEDIRNKKRWNESRKSLKKLLKIIITGEKKIEKPKKYHYFIVGK